ncbi:hypothetical protein [Muricoccus aerilatus]|uniref:hypothetical protein n=1 Tax=Muricoccus aerilatus TaxID=452982 RepID=UPI0005C20170|nr:hypothetical protein [Roseomonas aerilata]
MRDRILAAPVARRLEALDHEEVRAALTPEHRADIRASIVRAADASRIRPPTPAAPPQEEEEEIEREQAARRAHNEANRAALERENRLDRVRPWIAWGLAPAGAVLPVAVAAFHHGWSPLHLASVVPSLASLPAGPVWTMVGAVVVAAMCAFIASRAQGVRRALGWAAGAVLAGVLLLGAARYLPLKIFKIGVATSAGEAEAGVVVRLRPTRVGLANLEVLRGAGSLRRGQLLEWEVDPASFFDSR